jgi:CelD/BcsL family acetyltransferase involved in cellulose biosynthesis
MAFCDAESSEEVKSSIMRIVEARDGRELGALEAGWRKLQETAVTANVFQSYEWVSLWWKHFGEGKELRVFFVLDGETPVLAAPFFVQKTRVVGLPAKKISVLGDGLSSHMDFLRAGEPGDALEQCIETLCRAEKGWDILAVRKLPEESETLRALRRMSGRGGFSFLEVPANRYPFIAVDGSFDSYLKTKVSKRLRKTLRNRQNRMKSSGNTRFLHECEIDLDMSFEELISLAEKGWKHRVGKDPLTRANNRSFFRELAKQLRDAGVLSLSCVELDGEKIAFDLSFIMRGTYFAYYMIFDESRADLSPGKIMVAHMIEEAFGRGVSEINLSEGQEEYKLEWTSSCHDYREAYLLNRRSPLFIPLLSSLLMRKGVKSSPLLRKCMEKAKALVRGR